jgi:hypothetical protein
MPKFSYALKEKRFNSTAIKQCSKEHERKITFVCNPSLQERLIAAPKVNFGETF